MQPLANLPSDQRKLLKLFKGLDAKDQVILLAFAEFLQQRSDSAEKDPSHDELSADPILIERPAKESVVAAIRRLSASYHMLDTSTLLTKTSSLMTSHLIHGRSASDVIDELEELFAKEHADFLGSQEN